ncbi:MAG: hypothetical protein BV456_11775 [Thermoplasmata archaeon M8B2D]|nr:MAG: hypothetical protein BV456_11775 [Thermoplasmata archaeon M8B2D]
MRVGTSPLYLLEGQEEKLEERVDNLKHVEKEAFLKLKKKKLLVDSKEEPATRVALRNIRDFAIPFKFGEEIMWRYAFTPQNEIRELLSPKKAEAKPRPRSVEKPRQAEKKVENIFSKEDNEPKPEFFGEVMRFLGKNNIEFLEEMQTNKKEIVGKVRIQSGVGKIDFLLVAKNKKTTSKDEISAATQMANYNKMPCLFVLRKKISRAIQKVVEDNNLIRFGVL